MEEIRKKRWVFIGGKIVIIQIHNQIASVNEVKPMKQNDASDGIELYVVDNEKVGTIDIDNIQLVN